MVQFESYRQKLLRQGRNRRWGLDLPGGVSLAYFGGAFFTVLHSCRMRISGSDTCRIEVRAEINVWRFPSYRLTVTSVVAQAVTDQPFFGSY